MKEFIHPHIDYHYKGVSRDAYRLPFTEIRSVMSIMDGVTDDLLLMIRASVNGSDPTSSIPKINQQAMIAIVTEQAQIFLFQESIRLDPTRQSTYMQFLSDCTLPIIQDQEINTIQFFNKIMNCLLKWNQMVSIHEAKFQVFCTTFELRPQDYQFAGYPMQEITKYGMKIKGGYCNDFVFVQLNEEEAFPFIFNKETSYPVTENPVEYYAKWGYILVPPTSTIQNDNIIVYCTSLKYPAKNEIKHYGMIKNGKVISKFGMNDDIYCHDIDDVPYAYGNHYFILSKSFIPSLLQKLTAILDESMQITVLTGLGIQYRYIQELDAQLAKRQNNFLPSSHVVKAGKNFLNRYTAHANHLIRELKLQPDEYEASQLDYLRNIAFSELSDLTSKLKI